MSKTVEAPASTPAETHRAALDDRRLTFQRCRSCEQAWLPAREECPKCWSSDWVWEEASGKAEVVSWVVYHTAFDKRFAGHLPYNVAVVQLAEGPRMVTNLIDLSEGEDVIGQAVTLAFEEEFDRPLPRFKLRGP
ncbi:MAG TPA: OB-fold domain-containing protein [Tianweitania sediminis]|jgi:hypothetical protein|nr:OB-fold domain-containing protein [Tianweitania sediminis]